MASLILKNKNKNKKERSYSNHSQVSANINNTTSNISASTPQKKRITISKNNVKLVTCINQPSNPITPNTYDVINNCS